MPTKRVTAAMRQARSRDRVGSNLRRLVAAYPFLSFGDLCALTMALLVLMFGALLLAAPFIVTAATLVGSGVDR